MQVHVSSARVAIA
jgi:hypothetical protein